MHPGDTKAQRDDYQLVQNVFKKEGYRVLFSLADKKYAGTGTGDGHSRNGYQVSALSQGAPHLPLAMIYSYDDQEGVGRAIEYQL